MGYTSLFYYLLLLRLEYIRCSNITQVESLYSDLFGSYNNILFPLIDHNDIVDINTTVGLVSINKFDELSGEIEFTLLFYLSWIDERLMWNPSDYGKKVSLLVPAESVWRPQIFVLQSFDKMQEVSNASMMVRIHSNGTIQWNPGNVLKLVCSVDVTYFPFDSQNCEITVIGWVYTNNEVKFHSTQTSVHTDFMNPNSQWSLQSATVKNISSELAPPSLNIFITLKRRSDFFVIYIIVPVTFLGSINNLVFVMPASSGERTSVAITAFLSFVVYMEMVNDNVPESSAPMAYIYYYLLFLMLYSTIIMFMCILSLRIYDKEGEVPAGVKKLLKCVRWWRLLKRNRKTGVYPARKFSTVSEEMDVTDNKINEGTTDKRDEVEEVTWKIVGKTYDKYCWLTLLLIYWIVTIHTFTNLTNNSGFDF